MTLADERPTTTLLPIEFSTDGRHRRRERNVEVVRCATLEMLNDGIVVTAEALAERSGVAVRTIYRHFGGPSGAVEDAIRSRLAAVADRAPAPTTIDSFDDRITAFVEDRLRCVDIMLPLLTQSGSHEADVFDEPLASDLESWFGPELAAMAPVDRRRAATLGMLALRFASLKFLLESADFNVAEVRGMIEVLLRRHLTAMSST